MRPSPALLTFNASIYYATGNSPRRRGNGRYPTIVPYETFEAADGSRIDLGIAGDDDLWQRFCTELRTSTI